MYNEDLKGTASIGGRTTTNLRFADDIDGLAEEEEELVKFCLFIQLAGRFSYTPRAGICLVVRQCRSLSNTPRLGICLVVRYVGSFFVVVVVVARPVLV